MDIKSGILALMLFLLPQAELKTKTGEVISVKDGDTLIFKDNRDKIYKVRLADIDAPEIAQPFGRPAKRLLEDLALDKVVRVNYTQVDKYGRLIGEIYLADGKMLNEEAIKAGLAWHYRVKNPHSTFLEKMEYKAWKKKLGLWVQDKPIPPWEFRRESRVPTPPSDADNMDYDLILAYGIIGYPKSQIYQWPACKDYAKNPKNYIHFGNLFDAETLGYRASRGCDIN
jgi:micrococcal nuclease